MSERAYKLGLVAVFLAASVGLAVIGERDGAGLSWLVAVLVMVLA